MSRNTFVRFACGIALALALSACDGDGDAGVAVCELTGGSAAGCADETPELGADVCRCGSRWYWNGASCTATSACECFSGCERLFETEAACADAHASCGADGG
jgi:hypothetical protein